MKNFSVWSRSRSRLFLPGAGAGADPSRSEPESAPGPWRPGAGAGAAQKSGGSATLANRTQYAHSTHNAAEILKSRTLLIKNYKFFISPELRSVGENRETL